MEYRFYAVDWFEGRREVLCQSNSLDECYKAVLERRIDTDGECWCEIEDTYTSENFDVTITGFQCEKEEEE